MRKRLPVIVLIVFHLLLVIGLAVLNPIENHITKTKGTLHTFNVESSIIYGIDGDWDEYVGFNCTIHRATGDECGAYATISTDENGFSYISEIGDKPEGTDYLKTEMSSYYSPVFYFHAFRYDATAEYYNKALTLDPSLIDTEQMDFTDNYNVTVKAWVYKGKVLTEGIYVNGVPFEEFVDSNTP